MFVTTWIVVIAAMTDVESWTTMIRVNAKKKSEEGARARTSTVVRRLYLLSARSRNEKNEEHNNVAGSS